MRTLRKADKPTVNESVHSIEGVPKNRSLYTRWRSSKSLTMLSSLLLMLAIWWLAAIAINDRELLPTPDLVAKAFVVDLTEGELVADVVTSLVRVLVGFLLSLPTGLLVGFALGWYPVLRALGDPPLQFLRVIPAIAIIPLVIVYLGIGEEAKIFVIWLASFLSVVVGVYSGVRSVDSTLLRAARVLGARDTDLFFDIIVPASVPYTMIGVRLGLAQAWSTVVAAELIAASQGLGYLVLQSGTYHDIPLMLVGIILIGVIGLLLDRVVLRIDARLTRWQEREER